MFKTNQNRVIKRKKKQKLKGYLKLGALLLVLSLARTTTTTKT